MPEPLQHPLKLYPIFRERVWGRDSLEPLFSTPSGLRRIGEVWFTFEENQTAAGIALGELLRKEPEILGEAADPRHPGVCPLLVKLLFTTERLSVQVHPDDTYAQLHHASLGKTEAWYVMNVEPPGEVAAGFREELNPERFRAAVKTGEVENLLEWRKVKPGEVVFVPAGTVHAIGAGVTVCEIQENSDITYRLFDYGRPRELHLEHGVSVSRLGPHRAEAKTVTLADGRDELLACDYFRMERLRPKTAIGIAGGLPYYSLLICLKGSGTIAGEQFRAGEAWLVPAGSSKFQVEGPGSEWIFSYTAAKPANGITNA